MKWRQNSVLVTGQNVQGFLNDFAAELGRVNRSVERGVLDAAINALVAASATQEAEKTAMTSLTKEKNARRKELLEDHLRLIVAIAQKRSSGGTSSTPEIQTMRMPPRRIPDDLLVLKARGFADGAAKYTNVFVAQKMPRDFAQQARAAAHDLLRAIAERDRAVSNHVRATEDAAHQTMIIRSAIRVLHGLVHSRLHKMKRFDLVETWMQVKRYPKKPGVKRQRKKPAE